MNRPAIEIRTLAPDDQPLVEAFCLPRLDSSMFLLANSRTRGMIDRGEPRQGTYAAAFNGAGAIVALASYSSFWGSVIVQCPDHADRLVPALVEAVGAPVGGILGPADQVRAAAAALGLPTDGPDVRLHNLEGLYALALDELVVPPALMDGAVTVRPAEVRDMDRLAQWHTAYEMEELNHADTPRQRERSRVTVVEWIETGRQWIAEHGGEPVAMGGFNAALDEAVQLGGVFTPPALRGRGYARCAVAGALLDARRRGVGRAILFTGERNRPAIRAYTALGFERVGDYRVLLYHEPLRPDPRKNRRSAGLT